jgi:hypothetical protein
MSPAVTIGTTSFQMVTYLFDSLSSFAPNELSRQKTKSRTTPTRMPIGHERTVM